ncbi:hypothetical protein F3I62_19050 [Pseudomonas sp. R-28-1W-6]|uniref:hypothetical protein n=1 Tax=Pseudomonas sp. R-28-1W-6 TaxID=2650101 RepID=UPI001365EA38|nr:hypothetical protein [Pseudomonas sp. R-28-1W-6]MWV14204.1 hypothetical protein [Pseudomonas sp. R-28-1W-6]
MVVIEGSSLAALRGLRKDARDNLHIRERLRFYVINRLDKNDTTREDMVVLRMIERLDKRHPLGKQAGITTRSMMLRIKAARDEQPVKGLEDPWKSRLEMLELILPGSVVPVVEPEMNIRRLRQLLHTWHVYESFSETLNDSYNVFREKERVLRARAENALDKLPARLRRHWLEADLGV